mmetsp:Transcript_110899/g.324423  ORF Transcript_110899/g.324423 Transcript_110899/m.324423 type:complete len:334 (+) Transcript_110899:88-1089(+)
MEPASGGHRRHRAFKRSLASASLLILLYNLPACVERSSFVHLSLRGSRDGAIRSRAPSLSSVFKASSPASGATPLARPALCLTGVLVAVVALRPVRRCTGSRSDGGGQRLNSVARGAADEGKLLKLVRDFPEDYDQDDIQEVVQICKKVRGVPRDAFQQFVGSWKAEWNSRSGCVWASNQTSSLKLRSSGALPAVQVQFVGAYRRVMDAGGAYETVDVFTVPGADGAQAAMVLSGPWKTGSSQGEWGEGAARTRCGTHFQTVRLALSSQDPEASKAMLEAAGLGEYLEPREADERATYVDLDYISGSVCVSKDEAGTVNVLTRLAEAIPFDLD